MALYGGSKVRSQKRIPGHPDIACRTVRGELVSNGDLGAIKQRRRRERNRLIIDETTSEDESALSQPSPSRRNSGRKQFVADIPPWFGLCMPYADNATTRRRSARIASYFRSRIHPLTLDNDVSEAAWTTAFYQHPVLFHTFHWSTTVHIDLCNNQISASVTKDALAHRLHAIHLLNEMLSEPLQQAALEIVILVIMVLSTNELTEEVMAEMFTKAPLPFEPPMPTNDFKTFSRLRRAQMHARFMVLLVHRLGGIEKLRLPGLADTIAICDIAQASRTCAQPTFPSHWHIDASVLHANALPPSAASQAPGRGFFVRIPYNGLSPALLRIMVHLATLSRIVTAHSERPLSHDRRKRVIATRNALQYDLLVQPEWDVLSPALRETSNEAVCKSCWLTAIIYSNAVLFGFPSHQGWHTKLAHRLRVLLEDQGIAAWPEGLDDMSLWVLFVGGMAAFRSPDREFFEISLRRVLARKGRLAWAKVEGILNEFMWSDFACRHGASVLWQSL